MTRQQAIEREARERALAKEKGFPQGALAPQSRDRSEIGLPTGVVVQVEAPGYDDVRAALTRFADALGAYLDTLREAAVYGPNPELAGRYDVLREELTGEYGGLRTLLVASLEPTGPTDTKGFDFHGLWSDPFERLLRAESLNDSLEASPAATASDAMRAVKALDACWKRLRSGDVEGPPCG